MYLTLQECSIWCKETDKETCLLFSSGNKTNSQEKLWQSLVNEGGYQKEEAVKAKDLLEIMRCSTWQ